MSQMSLWWERCDYFMEVPIFSETPWKDPFPGWMAGNACDDWKCAREALWAMKVGLV